MKVMKRVIGGYFVVGQVVSRYYPCLT